MKTTPLQAKALRQTVAANLADYYSRYFLEPSGKIHVKLRFSENPKAWGIRSSSRPGEPFKSWEPEFVGSQFKTDIHLDAVISQSTWQETSFTVPDLYCARLNKRIIIAGAQSIIPPQNVDRLELLCVCHLIPRSKVVLRPHWVLRFCQGPLQFYTAEFHSPPPPLKTYLPQAIAEFERYVAHHVANMLQSRGTNKPSQIRHQTIEEWSALFSSLVNFSHSSTSLLDTLNSSVPHPTP